MEKVRWGDTVWRRLDDGTIVNVHRSDEPHQVLVDLTDGTSRAYSFASEGGTSVVSVTVDGERFTRVAKRDYDDLED